MASDPLTSTYKRYKSSTEQFLAWLRDSAPSSNTAQGSVKGRHQPKKKPPVDSYIDLAKAIIAATDPRVEIPLDILDVTKDVIRGRHAAAEWYRGLTDQSTVDSNRTHRHFLGVIEEAFELLRKEHKTRQPKRKKKVELPTDSSDLSNVFAQLKVEETTRAFESAPSRARTPRHQAAPPAKSESETMLETESTEEKLFVIWCHFKDLFELRLKARATWKQYCNGEVSFLVACQVFDKAVRIAVILSKEFSRTNPDLQTFESIMLVLGEEDYMVSDAVCHQFENEMIVTDDLVEEDKQQFLCMPAWCAIADVDELLPAVYHRTAEGEEQRNEKPASVFPGHPVSKALLQIIGDLADTVGLPLHGSTNTREDAHILTIADGYTHQLLQYIMLVGRVGNKGARLPGISSGLLVATQMYMDLYDILDGQLDRGVMECLPVFEQHEEISTSHRDWKDDTHLGPYTKLHVHPRNCERLELRRGLVVPNLTKSGRSGWSVRLPVPDLSVIIDCFIPLSILETLPVLAGRAAAVLSFQTQVSALKACEVPPNCADYSSSLQGARGAS